jgi:hypothetical protein
MFTIHCSFQYSPREYSNPHLLGTSKAEPLNVPGLITAGFLLLAAQFVFDFVYQSFLPFLLLVCLHAVLSFLAGLRRRATRRHPPGSHVCGCPWRDVYSCQDVALVLSLLRDDFADLFSTKSHLEVVSIDMLLEFVE